MMRTRARVDSYDANRITIEVEFNGEISSMVFERREDGSLGLPPQTFEFPGMDIRCLAALTRHAEYLQGGWVTHEPPYGCDDA